MAFRSGVCWPSFESSLSGLTITRNCSNNPANSSISCRKPHACTNPPPSATFHSLHGRPILERSIDCKDLPRPTHVRKPKTKGCEWNPAQRIAAHFLNWLESNFVAKLEMKQSVPPAVDPQIQIAGNFAPVEESSVRRDLEVVGTIPECLDGVYVRNGANPRLKPKGGHHLFDGDGMIHAVMFRHGHANYSCRYTRTYRLEEEEKQGRSVFPKAIGELHGHAGIARLLLYYARTLTGILDINKGLGLANAGLIFFNGTLLAMSEDDLPYAVHVTRGGDLETLGRFNFQGQLKSPMIAHPKIDPKTRELFALSYNVIRKPYLKYFYFSPDGRKSADVAVHLDNPTMIHDFAITENHIVIPDQQMIFRLDQMLRGGTPVVYDRWKTSRFGILPRYGHGGQDVRWIDVPDCFCFHLWNAWEELNGDQIVLLGSCMSPADGIFNENHGGFQSTLSEIRLDKVTGTSEVTPLSPLNLEAGQVNRRYLGRKTRYAYLAVAEPWPKVSGVAKINVEEKSVSAIFSYGPGCFGGEPYFVPKTEDPTAAEDDGYLLSFVFDERNGSSRLLILDAASPNLSEVASIKIPSRVPYGFHGTFVSSHELAMQQRSPV
eukprot:TRINITY_DN19411_c0_g1_i1.p1 TRINITY_DN19411_c0_g1~~TRINITY_DN19411_c0_g1_i1.p1  ORF type:complete len:647 (-),score=12.71 TRINITY_DN19411_c0_g1_i1:464-2275(-)